MTSTLLLAAIILAATGASAFYTAKDDVIVLTPENFAKKVEKSKSLWIVEFYAPWCGHCKHLTPEWKKAAAALKGIAKVGAVDADAHRELGSKFGVSGFPTIKIIDGKNTIEYEGGRTAKDIVAAVLKQIEKTAYQRMGVAPPAANDGPTQQPGSDVVELSDETFTADVLGGKEPWLVEFYAPWCGHCKRLEPEWKKAASALKGKVKLGAIDATKYSKHNSKYGVQGFPTIKYFAAGGAVEDYQGGRTSADIEKFALSKAK